MKNSHILLLFILFFLASACKKNDPVLDDLTDTCVFEQVDANMDGLIDENESMIMQACFDSRFESAEQLQSNIIGFWELIGHGEGWIPSISQPCATIEISEDELIFAYADGNVDQRTTHIWQIAVSPDNTPYFIVNPPVEGLNLSIYCAEFMYGDATPRDGNMYLYQKTN